MLRTGAAIVADGSRNGPGAARTAKAGPGAPGPAFSGGCPPLSDHRAVALLTGGAQLLALLGALLADDVRRGGLVPPWQPGRERRGYEDRREHTRYQADQHRHREVA